jgi:protein phosphatase
LEDGVKQDERTPERPMAEEIRYAALSHIGASPHRTLLEDRSRAERIQTAGGLNLTLGVVADGVGGENAGERAAELAVKTIFDHCRRSTSEDIPEMLRSALKEANKRVHAESRRSRRKKNMGTTAAVAAVAQGRLYLAHAGDSRIYLIREGKTLPLTIDHTWANEVVRSGKLTPEEAQKHPRKEEIVRAIGNEAILNVDLGVWLRGGQEDEQEARAAQGLPLRPGDRVLICSDGVIKSRHDNPAAHYVEEQEFPDLLRGSPEKAVNAIIKQAQSRLVDDNVSAVVLEVPAGRNLIRDLPLRGLGIAAALALVILAGLWSATRSPEEVPAEPTLPEIPPLPSGFAFLSALEGSAHKRVPGAEYQALQIEDIVPSGQGVRLRTQGATAHLRLDLADGSILFLGPDTQIELRAIADEVSIPETAIVLEQGSVLVATGPDPGSTFAVTSLFGVTARAEGTLMGIQLDDILQRLYIDCFEGRCTLEGNRRFTLTAGQRRWMDGEGNFGSVETTRNEAYAFAGRLVPSPTPVIVQSPTPASFEPTQTLGPLFLTPTVPPSAKPTHTPRRPIPPSETPVPTSTKTPTRTLTPTKSPTPTETDEPPTSTPTRTKTPTATSSPTETEAPTETPTPSETAPPTPTETLVPTATETSEG